MKLLVIDPDENSLRQLTETLVGAGHAVDAFADGTSALEMLDAAVIDGVLTELDLGDLSGLDLMEIIHASTGRLDLGVILVTEPLDLETLRDAMSRGMAGYISKPVSLDSLPQVVENLLRGGGLTGFTEDESLSAAPPVVLDETHDDESDLVGQLLEQKYRIEELIGRGGMGAVYRAQHLFLQRPVAIKFLTRRGGAGTEQFDRFVREAQILARVQSPQIVYVHDFGFTGDDVPYIVMELLDGMTLRQLLRVRNPLPIGVVEAVAVQCARGLGAAHDAGVLHLDLKPSNVMLCGDTEAVLHRFPEVKLLDFGIARVIDEGERAGGGGRPVGTPEYMAPERLKGGELGPACDLYALGAVLYELLVGRPPFTGTDDEALVAQHLERVPTSPRAFRPEIPGYLERTVLRLLAKDAVDRYPSAADLLTRLLRHVPMSRVLWDSLDDDSPVPESFETELTEMATGVDDD